ncbi:MAG: carboxypeptidase-like regulatory domain-containing protein [Niabella sp.]
MKRLLSLILVLLANQVIYSQIQIKGRVLDSITNTPLTGVSIYVNGSGIGTTSDNAGNFNLTINQSSQLLVFSSVGFKSVTITVTPNGNYTNLVIRMVSKETELDTVIVKSKKYKTVHSKSWKEKFLAYFIGTGDRAKYCKIKNFSDIVLMVSKDGQTLKAQSDKPIEIINKWLGYKLYFNIEECYTKLNTGIVVNYGFTRFEDISNSDKKYEQRRHDLYLGSITHFIKSLYNNNLQEQGFYIRRATIDTNYERLRVLYLINDKKNNSSLDAKSETLRIANSSPDSSKYYYQLYVRQKNLITTYQNSILNADDILITDLEVVKEMHFKNYIAIAYDPPLNKLNNNDIYEDSKTKQLSLLSLVNDNSVFIFPNGQLTPPNVLFIQGEWKESNCIKNLMPFDYN